MLRVTAKIVLTGLIATLVPLVGAAPASAARTKSISIDDASVIETVGGSALSFRLKWAGAKGGAAPSVAYATSDGSASAGNDYTAASGTVSLSNGGCRCATVSVPVLDDVLSESTEMLTVTLSSPTNATIADGSATGTIYDNEGPSALVVLDATADENAGPMSFSVRLTNANGSPVSVSYATVDGSATAGSDYTAESGSLTFTPGQTSKTVSVTLTNDAVSEDDEAFTFELSNASGVGIVDGQGVGAIVNDDTDPNVSIGDATVTEGDTGTVVASLTLTLSAASGQETSVAWATSDATASGGSDYTASSGEASIPAGQLSGTVEVPVVGDLTREGDESFTVTISDPIGLTVVDGTGSVTVSDDDPVPTVTIGDVSVAEGAGVASVAFSLSNPSTTAVSFTWSTSNGTATAGSDYAASSGPVTIAAGDTGASVDVALTQDASDEQAETFTVAVAGVTDGVAGADGTVTITDDDATPSAMTLNVAKGRKIKARGILEPATTGLTVTVTLSRKKGARFVRVTRKTVPVKSLLDRDLDGLTDGAFVAGFPRPAKGVYKITVAFAGTVDIASSSRSATFRL